MLLHIAVTTAMVVTGTSIPKVNVDVSANKSYAKTYMLEAYQWDEEQFNCLDELWSRESGWRTNASNKSSGAYGIPQALPGSKMKSAGSDWKTNPETQIRWGLNYISNRYHTPCGAYQYFQKKHWY